MSLCELLGIEEPEIVVDAADMESSTKEKLTPFNFVDSISYDKKDLFEEHEDADKKYNAYIINRALSFHIDTVILANEMNILHTIPNKSQFDFLRHSVRRKKRYGSWIKAEKESEDITLIKAYYNYSNEKAKQALSILSPEQLDEIRSRMNKGGLATTQKRKGKRNA